MYILINLYFRNLNQHWLRIKSVDIIDTSGGQQFNVILGEDLATWLSSVKLNEDLKKEMKPEEKGIVLKPYKLNDHVYKPFSIPAQLQTEKWFLLQVKDNKTSWFHIKFVFIDGTEAIYKVDLK